jgi:hypothetical protein
LDISLEETSVCIVNAEGGIVRETKLDSADLGRSADDEDEAVQESGWDFCAVSVIP